MNQLQQPFHGTIPADKSKQAVWDICVHAERLHLENVYLNYQPGGDFAEYLMTIGPKSSIRPIPFAKSGTQEIYNPAANPVAEDIVLQRIYTRPDGSDAPVRHPHPAQLVNTRSYAGEGAINGLRNSDS